MGVFCRCFRIADGSCTGRTFQRPGSRLRGTIFRRSSFPGRCVLAVTGESWTGWGPVDVVISTEVIEHVYDPRGFLRTAHGLLKPGGILVLTTPYHGYLKNVILAVTGKLDEHFTVLWDHGHIKFWSRKTLTKALRETGFGEIEFVGSGRMPYLWKSMVLRARKN